MKPPLAGCRVLDLTHALAGPYCTMLLAAYGAEVYKLEAPDAGDIGRGWAPPFSGGEASYFLGLNAGKQGISIDLKKPQGLELCLRLADQCDVLIENLRPGTLDRLGLGYPTVHARNERLVYCSISGYGQTGPLRDDPAMDLIVQAASGLISITGTRLGEQVRCGHSVADTTSGLFALIGILMALRVRSETGEGQYVDVSMLDGLVSTMASNFAYFAGSRKLPAPMGTSFGSIVPYQTFPTADREIAIAIGSEKLWMTFCRAIDRPSLGTDPAYATNAARVTNRESLIRLLSGLFVTQPAAHWIELLSELGIPCAQVRNIQEVFECPQLNSRNMFPVLDHLVAGAFPVTGPPVQFSATPGELKTAAPALGAHTRSVLADLLQLTPEEIESLHAQEVIFT